MQVGDRVEIMNDPKYIGLTGEIVDTQQRMLRPGKTVTQFVIDLDDKTVLEHISLRPGDTNYIVLSHYMLKKL